MVKYNKAGWVEDLPSLITGRRYHSCSHYTDTSDQLVSQSLLSVFIAPLQVYLVVGGQKHPYSSSNYLASAEILVAGTYAWTAVSSLPQKLWKMRMVSLHNIAYLFGQLRQTLYYLLKSYL